MWGKIILFKHWLKLKFTNKEYKDVFIDCQFLADAHYKGRIEIINTVDKDIFSAIWLRRMIRNPHNNTIVLKLHNKSAFFKIIGTTLWATTEETSWRSEPKYILQFIGYKGFPLIKHCTFKQFCKMYSDITLNDRELYFTEINKNISKCI